MHVFEIVKHIFCLIRVSISFFFSSFFFKIIFIYFLFFMFLLLLLFVLVLILVLVLFSVIQSSIFKHTKETFFT